jgi:cytochrome c oxidase cbb3-type subunit 4
MDVNDFRVWFTVASMVVFAGIVFWALSKHNRSRFDDAANLPFADDDIDGASQSGVNNG